MSVGDEGGLGVDCFTCFAFCLICKQFYGGGGVADKSLCRDKDKLF